MVFMQVKIPFSMGFYVTYPHRSPFDGSPGPQVVSEGGEDEGEGEEA